MSDDDTDKDYPASMEGLAQRFFVSRKEWYDTHKNVENRLVTLNKRVDGHETQLTAIDTVMNRLEAEQFQINRRMQIIIEDNKVARDERFQLITVCQHLQTDVQDFMRNIPPILLRRISWAGGIITLLVLVGLFKDLVLPVLLRAFNG